MGSVSKQECTHIVIGIIRNDKHEVLVSRRKPNSHLAGLLEFPGGKLNQGETALSALKRELLEEVSVHVLEACPLIQIVHQYADRKVFLDVYEVKQYKGVIAANEGQELFWQTAEILDDLDFPAANLGIIRAINLPKIYAVTPDYSVDNKFLEKFECLVSREAIKIVQLRSHTSTDQEYNKLAKQCADLCDKYEVKLILNRSISAIRRLNYSGVHLTSKNLLALTARPLDASYVVGASCHNAMEVKKANDLKLDYIFIGPVLEKAQLANTNVLGWEKFSALTKQSSMPSYAIGGVGLDELTICSQSGGQGIAAIRGLWTSTSISG